MLRILTEAEHGIGPRFDRVVIATTGLADPLPLLQTFMTNGEVLDRFTLNGVVTLVDTVNGSDVIERFTEAQRQVAVADLLLITKTELAKDPASQEDLSKLARMLAERNPNARVLYARAARPELVFSLAAFDPAGKPPDVREWLRFGDPSPARHDHSHHEHHHHRHGINRHGDTASAFCFSAEGPVDSKALGFAVTAPRASFGADLLRMKGLVEVVGEPDRPHVLHVVGHVWSAPRMLDGWPDNIDATRIVMIVAGPGRDEALNMLRSFLSELKPFRPQQTDASVLMA